MNKFLTWLKTWWWLMAIGFSVLGWTGNAAWNMMNENINMKRDIIELKLKLEDQRKAQLTEKDVLILIQLSKSSTENNIKFLESIINKK